MTSTYGSGALKGNSGPSMSMVDNMGSIGIGNYKGVMLCNRPFGGTVAKVSSGGGGEKTTFSCGVVNEPAGLNVPISAKEKTIKRSNKDSALVKHKKWLSELQKTKDKLEVEYMEEAKRKEEAQQKFQEHEKRMRMAARTVLRGEDKDSKDAKGGPESYGGYDDDEERAQAKYSSSAHEAAPSKESAAGAGAKQHARPAWAMTEKAADDQYEDLRLDEENDLLDFAKGLDFEKFMGDVEVQTVMERLRKRIADLERDVAIEDLRDSDAETRAAMRAKLERMGNTEASLRNEDHNGQSEESAAMSAARALLQDEEEMQAVHSAKSVAALLKTAKDKIAQVKASVHPGAAPSEPKVLNEPVIITHDPSEGSRLEVKNAISKLPYMNRNPAV